MLPSESVVDLREMDSARPIDTFAGSPLSDGSLDDEALPATSLGAAAAAAAGLYAAGTTSGGSPAAAEAPSAPADDAAAAAAAAAALICSNCATPRYRRQQTRKCIAALIRGRGWAAPGLLYKI